MISKLADRHIQAKNFTNVASRRPDLIVIHTAEVVEMGDSAENVARFFANQPKAPPGGSSAHYCTDNNSIVSGVDENDVAWAAPGANHNGVQIEISGRAAQDLTQWNDAFSKATLALTAKLVADIAKRHGIPLVHLTNAQLAAGKRGLIGHRQASQVFKRSTHTDPGTAFPWGPFITAAKRANAPAKVQWFITDAEGKQIGTKMAPFVAGPDEAKRLTAWFTRKAAAVVKEGRADGDVALKRLKT